MLRSSITRLYRLAWPVLIAQLATIGMMAIDTIVVGRSNTDNLAALAVGASIYVSLALALSGVVQALLPGIAHQIGRGDASATGKLIYQGFWLVVLLACFGDLVLCFPGWMIALAELPPAVEALTRDYLFILAFSLPASLGYRAFHAIAGGVGKTRPLMWLSIGQTTGHAILAPILVDSIVIGSLSIGAGLGVSGAALSQAFLAWMVCGAGVYVLWKSPVYQDFLSRARWSGPDWQTLARLLRVGLPMGLSYFVEITAFTVMA
ncbi:MAG: MATE family efflux transporter, partial [Rhodocyclales bacterium]|nr:MATE family efflux transporter [Rhodocyclales bacterium]